MCSRYIEVFDWRIPVDNDCFSAFRIFAHNFSLFYFAVDVADGMFAKGVFIMPIVRRFKPRNYDCSKGILE